MVGDWYAPVDAAKKLAKDLALLPSIKANADAALLAANLQIEIAESRAQFAQLLEEKTGLELELRKLRDQLALQSRMDDFEKRGDAYYRIADGSGPYCMRCLHDDRQLRPLNQMSFAGQVFGTHECASCKKAYTLESR